jgi:predicted AAA+ superfamily ATPase
VQRVPELLNVVHALIEQPVRRQFVLTGSSARKLRRGGIDLLAGRALYYTLHPFMAAEWPSFQLSTAFQTGLLPLVVASAQPEEVLKAYATLYLQEEVQLDGWARNVGSFARFLEMVSFSHAAVLNISNVARECQIERKTVAAYIEVLEDLLLSFRLPIFTRRARRQTSAHPKFYLFDAGVYRSLRPRGPLDRAEEIDGGAFEGLVAQHLMAWIAYARRDCTLYFWRTRAGVEVRFRGVWRGRLLGLRGQEYGPGALPRSARLTKLCQRLPRMPTGAVVSRYRALAHRRHLVWSPVRSFCARCTQRTA